VGPHDGFDVEPLLIAKVIVHSGDICTGSLANIAHRCGIEPASGKNLTRGVYYPFAGRI